jgi:plasmid maintenance system antidote protein VapI
MSATVRQSVLASGQTLYRVAKDSGVPYATLRRFVTGERAITVATLDKLCAYFGLRLVR